MPHIQHTIRIHALAPAKVAVGAECNGCGVCCLFTPCPLGMVLSGTRSGACAVLRWDGTLARYRCGALVAPHDVLVQAMPRGLRALAPGLAPALRRLALRWIAAGTGCDSDVEVLPSEPSPGPSLAPGHSGPGSSGVETASTTMVGSDLPTPNSGRTEARHPTP